MSTDGIEIRGYLPGDEHRILDTFNLVFRETCGPDFVDRTMAQWAWQYLANPVGHRITIAVASDGTVASQYAGVPMLADTPWGTHRFVHCVDSMTHPRWRQGLQRQGLFMQTGGKFGEQCLLTGEAVCYGLPIDNAFRIGQRYLQYTMLCVIDYLIRDRALPPLPMPSGITVQQVHDVPAEVDALYAVVAKDKRCLLRRDRRYLQWRYQQNPAHSEYELWAARRGEQLCGLLVLRPAQGLAPDAATIVDWLVPEHDGDAIDALLAVATRRQHELGRLRLLAVFPQWSSEWRAFTQRGFLLVPSATWLQRRLVHTIHLASMTPEFLQQSWWFTLGDTDLA